jgi:hypothetical protein
LLYALITMPASEWIKRWPMFLLGFGLGVAGHAALSSAATDLRWPVVTLCSVSIISAAMVLISRAGIRVEIFARESIAVSTRRGAIQAEVTRLRI